MIKALIFDFDGLILDTETPDYLSWQEIFRSCQAELPFEVWMQGVGTSLEIYNPLDTLESLVGPVDREKLHAIQKQRLLALIDEQPLLPGVREIIDQARSRQLKLAIATTSGRAWVDRHLARHDLDASFDYILTGNQVLRVKPYPDLYLAAIQALQISPLEGLALEDSPNGIQSAKAAGLYCVVVPNATTRHMDTHKADLRLESLSELFSHKELFS